MINMGFQTYGYLYGELKLIKDNHHDHVFIEKTGLIIIENNRRLFTNKQLLKIAQEIMEEQ